MKVKAPFQGGYEHAGQGFDGDHCYRLIRFVLRAYNPSKYPLWKWKFVWAAPIERDYESWHEKGRK